MLRELSSVFVAVFIVELLFLVRAVARGPAAYEGFLDTLANPLMIVLNVVALAFVLLHAVTFANLTPRAMVVRLRGRRVPSRAVLAERLPRVAGGHGGPGMAGGGVDGASLEPDDRRNRSCG